jgi:hypothetical protein
MGCIVPKGPGDQKACPPEQKSDEKEWSQKSDAVDFSRKQKPTQEMANEQHDDGKEYETRKPKTGSVYTQINHSHRPIANSGNTQKGKKQCVGEGTVNMIFFDLIIARDDEKHEKEHGREKKQEI